MNVIICNHLTNKNSLGFASLVIVAVLLHPLCTFSYVKEDENEGMRQERDERLAKEFSPTLVLIQNPEESSYKVMRPEQVQMMDDEFDCGYAEGSFQAMSDTICVKWEDRVGPTRRVAGKLFRGIIIGNVFLLGGVVFGSAIDDYYGQCRGWFPTNEQHAPEDNPCLDIGAFMV